MTLIQRCYQNNKDIIDLFCNKNKIKIIEVNNYIIALGLYEHWKIIVTKSDFFCLLHESIGCFEMDENLNVIRKYHSQNIYSKNLIEIFEYIAKHDRYAKSKNKNKKRYKNALKAKGLYR